MRYLLVYVSTTVTSITSQIPIPAPMVGEEMGGWSVHVIIIIKNNDVNFFVKEKNFTIKYISVIKFSSLIFIPNFF